MKSKATEYNSSQKINIFSMLKDVILEKDLIWLLAKRELIARYRRSFLGIAWSLLTPIATASVLYFVLSAVFKAKLAGGTGYAAFLMAGILLNNHLNQGGNAVGFSYSANAGIVTKIRTKPLVFPFVAVFGSYINFLLGIVPLVIFIFLEEINLKLTLLAVPILGIFISLLIVGIGIHVAVLASRYHDIHGIMSVIYNILGYATPIIYPLSIVQGSLRTLIMLNPLTGYVECIRGLAIDSKYFPSGEWLLYTFAVTLLVFVSALWRLRRSYSLIVESL